MISKFDFFDIKLKKQFQFALEYIRYKSNFSK